MQGNNMHQKKPAGTLPILSTGVIRRFRVFPPTFDLMLRRLHQADPAAARWLYSAAEAIAPADVLEKERYASLALGLYYMLNEQSFVNQFSDIYSLPAITEAERSGSEELSPGGDSSISR